jgi:hypothetical protein
MGHDDQSRAGTGELLDDLEDFADQFRVQRGRRFVEQENLRPQRQSARDGDALLLSAGEVAGVSVRLLADPTRARRSRAKSVASRRDWPRTTIGASMIFCSTVKCGKRLKFWNTMPTSTRRLRISLSFSSIIKDQKKVDGVLPSYDSAVTAQFVKAAAAVN